MGETKAGQGGQLRKAVLLVDDTPEYLTVLGEILMPRYRARSEFGPPCTGFRRERSVDLVLLGVMMPEMDGYKGMERLRSSPATAGIPVIFVTAVDTGHDRRLPQGGVAESCRQGWRGRFWLNKSERFKARLPGQSEQLVRMPIETGQLHEVCGRLE